MACSINILSMIYWLGQCWATEKLTTAGCFWKAASLSLGALGNWGCLSTTCCTAIKWLHCLLLGCRHFSTQPTLKQNICAFFMIRQSISDVFYYSALYGT